MICKTYEIETLQSYKFVVVLSKYQGKILLSRHKDRTTWETQGGHIESGETPLDAAKRELYEESGAVEFDIQPFCDYWAGDFETNQGASGMVFVANITKLGKLPKSEMAEVKTFDVLPPDLTYPTITPVLFGKLIIGTMVTVTVDRKMGTYHPKHPDIFYPINYGYVPGMMAADGEEQDAYIIGVDTPVENFTGKVVAIIHRNDDVEEKWVVCPENMNFTVDEIEAQVKFQEQYFDSYIIM